MSIRILPPEVASRIAAGEVVERPASIVKELVENALDAGAHRIRVEANEGGVALIRVVDDGCGIEPEELALAFSRHATSKLTADGDLAAIGTLGFRGEALPSVGAVAVVEAVSRPADAPSAARVRIGFGELKEQGAAGAPPGTSITVRDLFREQPARLKFLRSHGSEASQIGNVVSHYALAYPEVGFSLRIDGRETFSTTGSGNRREAAAGVYGRDLAAGLLEVRDEGEGYTLEALVSPPSLHRSNRTYINVFINRRWVRSRTLSFAVEDAYAGLLPVGRFPVAIVDLRLPAQEVDVNVHPAKAEVRLRDERHVFSLVQRPIRRALSGVSPVGTAPDSAWPRAPQSEGWASAMPSPAMPPLQSDLIPGRRHAFGPEPGATPAPAAPVSQPGLPAGIPILRPLGQAGTTYVIAEGPTGLYLIDQHAAHERILYERYLAELTQAQPMVQPLLAPVVLELTPAQSGLVTVLGASLGEHGFVVEPFGAGDFLLRAAPADLRREDPARAFRELLDLLTRDDAPEDPRRKVAASLACHAAVRAGQNLAPQEMRDLIEQLEACETPQTCPHGRPTMLHFSADELAKRFSRK